MEAVKSVLKQILSSRPPGESSRPPENTITPLSAQTLTRIQTQVRAGLSRRANQTLNIPQRYWGKDLPTGKIPQAVQVLQALQAGKSLFLTGATGSGKTHLAVALMNEWFAEGLKEGEAGIYPSRGRALFLPAVELFLEIKQSWSDNEGARNASEKNILDKYSQVNLLTLDDLGSEKTSEWSRQVLYLLIDRRYRNCKQIIITSNLSHGKLAEQLDDRIASRISEMGIVLNLGSKDYRLK